MRILITGATGFVGKNLIPKLEKLHEINEIILLVRDPEKTRKLFKEDKIRIVTLKEKIEKLKIDVVIHLAAYLTSKDDIETVKKVIDANINFGTLILDYIKELEVKYFLNFGTCSQYQYGDSLKSAYLYSATKTAYRSILDYYAETYNFKYYNIIPYTIYGGEDTQKKVIDYIKESFTREVDMTPGEQILDFIHIDDVCDFIIKLLLTNKEIPTKTDFFLGTGVGTSIKELSKILEKKYNKTCRINWGKLNYRTNDVMYAVAPIGNNLRYLNWRAKIKIEDAKGV